MKPLITMREALADPRLLGRVLEGTSWEPWRVLLTAMMGEELTPSERTIFTKLTGREREPGELIEEGWTIAGRRSGKTRAGAVLSSYVASMCEHPGLALGERGLALFLAPSQRQAHVAFNYAIAIFDTVPMLSAMVINRTNSTLSLSNGIDLEIRPAHFRGLRGVTCVCAICDEISFFHVDETASNADSEILGALRPSLATTRGPLICVTTPHAKRGEAYQTFQRQFGPHGDRKILVAQGESRAFNESLPENIVTRAIERDAQQARAEYLGLFRDDIESFVSVETVRACTGDHVELPPLARHRYHAFCDPSGGSVDSFTIAISHREGEQAIVDAIREVRPPFSPESVVDEFVALMRRYRVTHTTGDRYGGEWPPEQFKKRGIEYKTAEKSKSDLYRDLLPLLNSRRVLLPKSDRLASQLVGLERRVGRGSRDSIDHIPGCHDDIANVVAGAADLVAIDREAPEASYGWWSPYGGIRTIKTAPSRLEREAATWSRPCMLSLDELEGRVKVK